MTVPSYTAEQLAAATKAARILFPDPEAVATIQDHPGMVIRLAVLYGHMTASVEAHIS